ncbi:HlyD family efflux transporter periplasmic adaptor subunit [Allofournierella massiliensis]|uniref:HlyD family efflux transporter periplasmic adaptor subunit n=1 Tax=Allofournierella massiliensis TaxID=1650663 RepID=A0ABT7USW2_9FIRM|nr:HlyD family efflux transporter periplasmic adaptor subunit [Fournierella massiliensis]MDM8201977.1 HlyD family efflux transporter periplasmic adaptor subunit [Fournierella massiliensis]
MSKVKTVLGRVGGCLGRHKKALIAVVLILAIAVAGLWYFRLRRPTMPVAVQGGSYVRTVTLQKGTLDDSISASGTVESSDVSNVTTDLKYTVKTVDVQVGDMVEAGDVICTLDTESLEKSIEKAKETLADSMAQAEKAYQKAQESLAEAQTNTSEAKTEMDEAESAKNDAWSAYDSARSKVSSFQTEADNAAAQEESALSALNDAMAVAAEKQTAYNDAYGAWKTESDRQLAADYQPADGDAEKLAGLQTAMEEAQAQLEAATAAQTSAEAAYKQASEQSQAKQQALNEAQNTVGLTGLQTAYQQAQSAYEQAQTAYEQAVKNQETAQETCDDALESYNKSSESDELTDLQEQLEQCTLTAETSGKVTAVNATVGSMIDGAAATIQNTDSLKVAITIPEYDIESVQVGMTARITSDVTDKEVSGTLSQISPTATGGGSSSSSFAAEVTIDDADSGLLIGTNAKVEIILSTTEDVFAVPLDAIGENEAGESVIYVQTGEEDGEPVFEEMTVTVGEQNDYYAQISGAELEEGLVVRASADEDEATEELDTSAMMPGGDMGGDMQGSMIIAAPADGGSAGAAGGGGRGGMGGGPAMGG